MITKTNNRIDLKFELLKRKNEKAMISFITAGDPDLETTIELVHAMEEAGADIIELGIPYSDPLADGPVIQNSSQIALQNGMNLPILFEQLKDLRKRVSIPVLLMGYVNPMLQYGVEKFCNSCAEAGVDGIIVPDLPMDEYENLYKNYFVVNNLSNIFLVTPQTSEERIRKIDELSNGFIYLLSSSSTTGKDLKVSNETDAYFKRIGDMKLKNPTMIGFGISDRKSFNKADEYTRGAIVGSAFVKFLDSKDALRNVKGFLETIRE